MLISGKGKCEFYDKDENLIVSCETLMDGEFSFTIEDLDDEELSRLLKMKRRLNNYDK